MARRKLQSFDAMSKDVIFSHLHTHIDLPTSLLLIVCFLGQKNHVTPHLSFADQTHKQNYNHERIKMPFYNGWSGYKIKKNSIELNPYFVFVSCGPWVPISCGDANFFCIFI